MSDIGVDENGLLVTCPHCGQRNRLRWQGWGRPFRCGKCHHELSAPAAPIDIPDEQAWETMIARAPVPVLVDFWAPWCGPCRMAAPEFEKVAAQGQGHWLVAKVNTEELPQLSNRFGVRSIPTMVTFRQGREVGRQVGAMPAARIRQFVESFAA